ncbi:MAG: LamG domain-containing protein [Kiritimatiellae bacterium]|nr:LamG domain-containing protein [Kiritimatiellia bacterium]
MNATRYFVLTLAAAALALTASAKTYRWRGGGDGVHWSDPKNWVDQQTFAAVTNLESGLSTTLYFYTDPEDADNPKVYAFDTVNDLGPDFRMGVLQVGGYARSFRVTGDPIYTAGLTDAADSNLSTVFTFDCDVYACGTNAASTRVNTFTCKTGHIRYFNGLVSHARDLTDAYVSVSSGGKYDPATGVSGTYIEYSGGGTNVFNGGYRFVGNNSNYLYASAQDYFTGGTAIMNCDCIESWFHYRNGVHFIIGPKGSVRKVNTALCDFWQLSTTDIYGKFFSNQAIPGQSGGTATFNVFEGGFWDVATSFRVANNTPTIINIDGGVMVLRDQSYAFADGSYTELTVKSGVLYRGANGADALRIGHNGSTYKASGTAGTADEKRNTLNLDGGLIACQYLYETTPVAAATDRNRDTCFNGGVLRLTASGDVYRYGSAYTTAELKATTKAYLRAGGLKVDTVGNSVNWNKQLEVRGGDSAGPVVKYGSGALNVTDDMTAARAAFVTGGVFAVKSPAFWTGAVTLAPGAVLTFVDGPELAIDGLTSDNGVVRLTSGKKLALATAPVVAAGKGLIFDVPTGADGTYTLLTCDEALDPALPDQCAVFTPTTGKSATFALADGDKALTLTVAAGTAPSPASARYDLTPWVDPNPPSVGVDGPNEYVNDAAEPQAFTEGKTYYGNLPFMLKGGSFELKDEFAFDSSYGQVSFRNAGTTPLEVAIQPDAILNVGTLLVGGAPDTSYQASVSNKATIVRQTGGRVTVRTTGANLQGSITTTTGGYAYFGPYYSSEYMDRRLAPQIWEVSGGVFSMLPHTSLDLNGRSTFVVNGGKAELARVYSGHHSSSGLSFLTGNFAGSVGIRVTDGELNVGEQFSWIATGEAGRYTEFALTGGKATLPATTRTNARVAARQSGEAAMLLDGGELTLSGEAAYGESSVADYFSGLDELLVGGQGVTIRNAGMAVVSNRVLGAMTGAGTLVKKGEGTLELAKAENVLGGLDVQEGRVKAALATTPEGKVPTGLIAWWDFNGEGDECLRDKSDHGFDLTQVNFRGNEDGFVQFVEDELTRPGRGKAARWAGTYESLKAAAVQSAATYDYTVNMWIYLDNMTTLSSHIMFYSNRIDPEFTNNASGTEIGYKATNGPYGLNGQRTAGITMTENTGISCDHVGPIPLKTWMMVTLTCGIGGTCTYLNGQLVTNNTANTSVLLGGGRIFTLGQGIAASEFLNKGAMMDDVMIFGRTLSADEVKGLYDAQCTPESLAIPTVAVAAGAAWDMNGASNVVTSVTGGGEVVNGTIEIAEAITCAGKSLHIAKPVITSAAGTIDFGVDDTVRLPRGEPYALFSYDEMSAESAANLAQWTVAGAGSDTGRLRIRVHAEGCTVYGLVPPAGTVLIFK